MALESTANAREIRRIPNHVRLISVTRNGALREPVQNSDTFSQAFDSAPCVHGAEPTISPGSLHAPYDLLPLLAVGKIMIKADFSKPRLLRP